jgi:hypothetical protein
MAIVMSPLKGVETQYRVRFESDPSTIYDRFVDAAAQADPEAFVANLNASRVAAIA